MHGANKSPKCKGIANAIPNRGPKHCARSGKPKNVISKGIPVFPIAKSRFVLEDKKYVKKQYPTVILYNGNNKLNEHYRMLDKSGNLVSVSIFSLDTPKLEKRVFNLYKLLKSKKKLLEAFIMDAKTDNFSVKTFDKKQQKFINIGDGKVAVLVYDKRPPVN